MNTVEALESRRLLSTSPFGVTFTGTLIVQGTGGDDVIVVSTKNGKAIVSMNALNGFEFEGFKRIRVEGAAGSDRIVFSGELNVPVSILGGAGRDKLHGSGPRVTLSGGAGNDDLIAEGSHGLMLVGGRGGDRLFGSAGNDTLFGGEGDDYASIVHPGDVQGDTIERIVAVAHAS